MSNRIQAQTHMANILSEMESMDQLTKTNTIVAAIIAAHANLTGSPVNYETAAGIIDAVEAVFGQRIRLDQ